MSGQPCALIGAKTKRFSVRQLERSRDEVKFACMAERNWSALDQTFMRPPSSSCLAWARSQDTEDVKTKDEKNARIISFGFTIISCCWHMYACTRNTVPRYVSWISSFPTVLRFTAVKLVLLSVFFDFSENKLTSDWFDETNFDPLPLFSTQSRKQLPVLQIFLSCSLVRHTEKKWKWSLRVLDNSPSTFTREKLNEIGNWISDGW